ncbi:unnamed protein product [Owenia fusiformis]|uniref:Uncharacterized protein n=1 Tax=Owenia fusiformis TaxID=6347 RepID=A0A8S4PZU2_OWEFU|nr:unnamed protein product [Owenia fusiformis]
MPPFSDFIVIVNYHSQMVYCIFVVEHLASFILAIVNDAFYVMNCYEMNILQNDYYIHDYSIHLAVKFNMNEHFNQSYINDALTCTINKKLVGDNKKDNSMNL